MTVEDLIKELKALDPNSQVVISKDAEGNGFSPLCELALGKYDPYNTWDGEWWDQRELDEMAGMDAEDAEALHGTISDKAVEAVCLWPTN